MANGTLTFRLPVPPFFSLYLSVCYRVWFKLVYFFFLLCMYLFLLELGNFLVNIVQSQPVIDCLDAA